MPLCRTTRAFTTTRRDGDFRDSDRATLRPRPKVERDPFRPVPPKREPVWPAFFAARITCAA